jgi:hypothetical protein
LWLACTVTTPKIRHIGDYSIGLTILGKLNRANKNEKKGKTLGKIADVEI